MLIRLVRPDVFNVVWVRNATVDIILEATLFSTAAFDETRHARQKVKHVATGELVETEFRDAGYFELALFDFV
jgi:hypothetical protein